MGKVYGYCRISTPKQSIDRQVRNIKQKYPEAVIVEEVFTGTKFQGRKELDKILNCVKEGDSIVFDSVSRMSRNSAEGYEMYEELFAKGIELIFLKEPHINTTVYRKAISTQIQLTGTKADIILEAVNRYLMELAREQIRIAFEQSEKEVVDLRQRTQEGMETARLNGKQIGAKKGKRLTTKKSIEAKKQIIRYSRDFEGSLTDAECIKLIGIARGSYYKYKKDIICSRGIS